MTSSAARRRLRKKKVAAAASGKLPVVEKGPKASKAEEDEPETKDKTLSVQKKRIRKHGAKKREDRYVVFVGQLASDVTEEDLRLHFRKTSQCKFCFQLFF
jgi:RNA recognition motif-containing protein